MAGHAAEIDDLPVSQEHVVRAWDQADGLPSNTVSAIVQTPDGFLWLATPGGLARFDGVEFSRFSRREVAAFPSSIARCVALGADGSLWAGFENGGVFRRASHGFERVPLAGVEEEKPASILSIAGDGDGAMWTGLLDKALAQRWKDGQVTGFTGKDGIGSWSGVTVFSAKSGRAWFQTRTDAGYFDGSQVRQVKIGQSGAFALTPARGGGMWAVRGQTLYRCHEDRPAEKTADLPWLPEAVAIILHEDRAGALWVGTRGFGLFRYREGRAEKVPVTHPHVRCFSEDREGNLWVGLDSGGLNRLSRRHFFLHKAPVGRGGARDERVSSLAKDAGGRILAAQAMALAGATDGSNRDYSLVPGPPVGGGVLTICPHPEGGVWIGAIARTLRHWREGKIVYEESLPVSVTAMHVDRAGDLWLASIHDGLYRHRDGKTTPLPVAGGLVEVRALAEDAAGKLWAGTEAGRVFRRDGEAFSEIPLPGREPGEPVRFIVADGPDTMWIGAYEAGLYRWRKGEVVRLPDGAGFPLSDLRVMEIDRGGDFWFGTGQGFFRVPRAELEAVLGGEKAAPRYASYGRNEGLPQLDFVYGFIRSSARTDDGRLWFATSSGILEVVPPAPGREPAFPVSIQEVRVGDRTVPGDGAIVLPPRLGPVRVGFTVPHLSAPEAVRFRYRLSGADDDSWVFAGGQRSATFTHLPPGGYRFEVQAAEAYGPWLPSTAALAITVRAAWWETAWFRWACGIAGGISIGLLVRQVVRRRLKRRLRLLEQERAVERERTRIARDMHDDLGASLTQISIASQLAKSDPPERAAERIDHIAAIAHRTVSALDEIVWAVDPKNDTLAALLDYVGQQSVDFLAAAGLACKLELPETVPPLRVNAGLRHHLFLAVREALNNAVKHAAAKSVRLAISRDGARLRVSVKDDGRGFSGAPSAGSNGLENMAARMKELGGDCRIESAPAAGTEVTFELPLPAAGA